MENNIYDLITSELILRLSESDNVATAALVITSDLNSNEVPTGFSDNVIFTSEVINMPTGYAVQGTTHTITYPSGPSTTGSATTLSGSAQPVSIAILGGTYTVTSTVILEDVIGGGGADITLNATYIITAVDPAYYGVQAYSATPTTSALTSMAVSSTQFNMTTSSLGRLVLALPTGYTTPVTITDQNGIVFVIANDFTMVTNLGYNFYQLNWDTQLTGSNIKTFTISYS